MHFSNTIYNKSIKRILARAAKTGYAYKLQIAQINLDFGISGEK